MFRIKMQQCLLYICTVNILATTGKRTVTKQQQQGIYTAKHNRRVLSHLIITCWRFADLSLAFRFHTLSTNAGFSTLIEANVLFVPQFQSKIFLAFGTGPTNQTFDALARCFTFCMEFQKKKKLIPLCQRIVLTWISYNSQRITTVQSCTRLKFIKYKKNEKWSDSSSSDPSQRSPRYKSNWTVRSLTSNEKHINCVIVVLSKRCL